MYNAALHQRLQNDAVPPQPIPEEALNNIALFCDSTRLAGDLEQRAVYSIDYRGKEAECLNVNGLNFAESKSKSKSKLLCAENTKISGFGRNGIQIHFRDGIHIEIEIHPGDRFPENTGLHAETVSFCYFTRFDPTDKKILILKLNRNLYGQMEIRWTQAATPPNIPSAEFDALYALYNSTNGTYWSWKEFVPGEPWNFSQADPNPCFENWEGVNCSCSSTVCHVVKLTLSAHNLTGSLDASLGNLTALQELSLVDNQLVGTMPPELSRCKNISFFDLRQNSFTGTIPDSYGEITQLNSFNVSMNDLRGTIPGSLFTLPNISVVTVDNNNFHGRIPDEFYESRTIRVLEASHNYINGTISSSIGAMSQLFSFRVNDNLISGTVPKSFGNLTNLYKLFLGINFLEGTIPA
eukprot:gene39610-48223_t